jgi:hypothetical protein
MNHNIGFEEKRQFFAEKWQKTAKMDENMLQWAKISENMRKWPKISENMRKWPKIGEIMRKWPKIGENMRKWPKIIKNRYYSIDPDLNFRFPLFSALPHLRPLHEIRLHSSSCLLCSLGGFQVILKNLFFKFRPNFKVNISFIFIFLWPSQNQLFQRRNSDSDRCGILFYAGSGTVVQIPKLVALIKCFFNQIFAPRPVFLQGARREVFFKNALW